MFPGKESVVNCQSELTRFSESYNNHLLKSVKLTKVTCLNLAKGHKRTLFKFLDFSVDADLIS